MNSLLKSRNKEEEKKKIVNNLIQTFDNFKRHHLFLYNSFRQDHVSNEELRDPRKSMFYRIIRALSRVIQYNSQIELSDFFCGTQAQKSLTNITSLSGRMPKQINIRLMTIDHYITILNKIFEKNDSRFSSNQESSKKKKMEKEKEKGKEKKKEKGKEKEKEKEKNEKKRQL
ncbi:hypothetical protein M0812_25197 [Anaeramoeba flamelloides]|uniref:Ribosomal protein S7 n=1 Tax=Anaeramoeba flamelloides TaxID=1746091 RepID=A0AAV7YIU6_9EUKA|nr:hypothetical protein M0812_25197 [Anaeramoeba flamelloides]